MNSITRSRGRPKGSTAGVHTAPVWQPKQWKPIHDAIITLAAAGLKNKIIANKLQLSEVFVGLIIRSPQGQNKLKEFTKLASDVIVEGQAEQLKRIQQAAIDNIEAALTDENIKKNSPLSLADRSIRVLAGVGLFKKDSSDDSHRQGNTTININNQQNNLHILTQQENAERIISGLDKLQEINAIVEQKKIANG
jgi:hypothetical protein